jgi:hypothetical protein
MKKSEILNLKAHAQMLLLEIYVSRLSYPSGKEAPIGSNCP